MAKKKELKTRNRTIYYFRCDFIQSEGFTVSHTLEQMVAASWGKLNNSSERTFSSTNDKSLVGMKISYDRVELSKGNKDCTLFSVGLYEEGAAANTIFKPSDSQIEIEASTIDAPQFQEYLDGKGFVCLHNNHLVISPTDTLRAGTINYFIASLIYKGGFRKESELLDIQQIANINSYQTIKKEGVKSITINSSTYLNTLSHVERTKPEFKPSKRIERFTKLVKSWANGLKEDDNEADLAESENLNARLVFTHDGRSSSDLSDVGAERLKNIAISLAETDLAGYVIMTKSGKKLTHEEIVLKNTVKVTEHGKSVKREEMWSKLIKTLEQYDKDGILEQ